MKRLSLLLFVFSLLLATPIHAQPQDSYDYWAPQRVMIGRGVQAVLMCNGLFSGNRTLQQVFDQELAYLGTPIGTAEGGDYTVDWDLQAVEVGISDAVPTMRAVFREGIGCVVLPPNQSLADIDTLPELTLPYPDGDPSEIPWPNGDLIQNTGSHGDIDWDALREADEWAFNRNTPEQDTLSLIVVHDGEIILERYAPGIEMSTRTRTWSTAKSIASTLIGMLVDEGRMSLDEPLGFGWNPENLSSGTDPRNEITLRHVLNMSSGLETIDNSGMEYATGSGLSYWAGASSVDGARSRALIREPGSYWDYENYDTLLAVYAMKQALGGEKAYAEFPRKALFDRIGMRNTLASTDRFGDFILSSQVYTNARDLARFGLLYLQDGMWEGERLISEEWIEFSRTPAPATVGRGSMYGGQWWLVPEGRTDVPSDAYSTNGNRGQYTVVVPSHNVVIVRRGLDYGRQGFSQWDLTREVLKAIE